MGRRGSSGHDYSDTELINGCRAGKALHRELLYKRYFSFAMSVCIRYADDENSAMEIVNDSYMKVLDNIDTCDTTRPFRAWYGRILVNTAVDNYRKNVKHNSQLPLETIATTEMAEPEIESDMSVADILNLFGQLPDNYRITFNLYEMEGYTHDEIGEMLGITASASRANLTRAKKQLRELYVRHFTTEKKRHEAV
jgi:RNA polymerase sigma-70 factor (ECF subfamily)